MPSKHLRVWLTTLILLSACSGQSSADAGQDELQDAASAPDGGSTDAASPTDASSTDAASFTDGSLCAAEICEGSVDEDCDGVVDNGCDCVDGEMSSCGMDMGVCMPGMATCEAGRWGECVGEIAPSVEICDGVDDENCDGTVDEGCCGNGTLDPGEACETGIGAGEGSCPASCDDNIACTDDAPTGAGCSLMCTNVPNDVCRSGSVMFSLSGTRRCTGVIGDLAYDGEATFTLTPSATGVNVVGSCRVWPQGTSASSASVVSVNQVLTAPGYTATASRAVSGGFFRCVVSLDSGRVRARFEWDFSRCCTYYCTGSASGSAGAPPIIGS